MKITRFLPVLGAALLAATLSSAQAQGDRFPTKPLRIVVPFAPGGSVDNIARPLALGMSEVLGQQVVVDSRPGASGNIGVDHVGQATADGYTMLLGNVSTNGINPSLYADRVKINISKDLKAVSLIAAAPGVLVVSPKFPANTVAEMIAYVKANPNKVNHASAGAGSYAYIDLLRLAKTANLEMVHVAYKGAGQFVAALAADEVQIAFINASTAIQLVRAGKLKALAATTAQRLPMLPEVPTMAEAGYPDIGTNSWHALFVPAATPQPVVAALFDAVQKTIASARFRDTMGPMTIEPLKSASPEQADRFVQKEAITWSRIVKEYQVAAD